MLDTFERLAVIYIVHEGQPAETPTETLTIKKTTKYRRFRGGKTMNNQFENVYFTDDKGRNITDLTAVVNNPITDEYRAKVLEITDQGANPEAIADMDSAEISAFIDDLGLNNVDDIVQAFTSIKEYLESITDEYRDPLVDFLAVAIDVEIGLNGGAIAVDIGDVYDDFVDFNAEGIVSTTTALSAQAEYNSEAYAESIATDLDN